MLSDPHLMPIRAVVFDLFDTLVDLPMDTLPRVAIEGRTLMSTMGALHEALRARTPVSFNDFARVVAAVDREWRATHWERDRELTTPERFARVTRALDLDDPELPGILTAVHMGMLESIAVAPPHHAALLARLHQRFRIGLCSNWTWTPTALAILEVTQLRASFDAIVISADHGLRKPRREIFESTLAALGVAPEEAVHVGDNLKADVSGAAALGIRTVWITRRVGDPATALARHTGMRPDHVIADLAELESVLA
jgi:HAD superfamily hydrolase (TIGR01509 family)